MGHLGPAQFSRFSRGDARPATGATKPDVKVATESRPSRRTFTTRITNIARKYLGKSSAIPATPNAADATGASLASPSTRRDAIRIDSAEVATVPGVDACFSPHLRPACLSDNTYYSAPSASQPSSTNRQESSAPSSPPLTTEGGLKHPALVPPENLSRLRVHRWSSDPVPPDERRVLARTYVHHLNHGEETGNGIEFCLVGALAESDDAIVYAAVTYPIGAGISGFPDQVAIKMRSKRSLMNNVVMPPHTGARSYTQALCEVRSMRKLAITGAIFNNQALATFQDKDWLYMVSPWYTFPLSDYIKKLNQKEKLSGELYHLKYKMWDMDFAFYAAELLLAMEELQKCNIVHLDIKADNVFVTPTGHLVLGDFDLSIPDISAGKGKRTPYNNVPLNHACGTPAYMAPELLEWASNRSRRGVDMPCPTQRADMWSLGVTLLQLALRLSEPYFEMLAPELFTSKDFHARTSALHEYLSYVWSMSGEERGEGGEKMARQLKKQLDMQVYNFLCGLLEMDPTKRTTIEEAKNDFLFVFSVRWKEWERGEYPTPPFAKRHGPPKSATVFAGPECAELHLLPGPSAAEKIEVDKTIPFYTYGLDWISPKILQGDKSSGPEHGVVDYHQAPIAR